MKLLRPKDQVLLALGIIGDVWDETRLLGGLVPSTYRAVYGWTPPAYKRNNFYQTIYRSLKTGEVEKIVVKGEPCFRLTSASRQKLIREFPMFKLQARPWKRIWTVGVFDIEEILKWLRRWVGDLFLHLGFGRLQRSVYISPYNLGEDLEEALATKNLAGRVRVFTQANLAGGHEKELALRVWPIEELNKEYEKIISDCLNVSKLSERERQKEIKRIRTRYLNLSITDPHLPFELLPKDWQGKEARGRVKGLE